MSLKVCVLTPSHWEAIRGGSQYQATLLTEHLRDRGVQVTYLTTRVNPSFEPEGYRIVQFSRATGLRRYGFFFDAWRLYRALRRERPDVIVQFVGCAHTGIAAAYARLHGAQMVWRVSSDRSMRRPAASWRRPHHFVERSFLDYGIRNANLIVAQTHDQKEALARNFGREDAVVVRNFHPTPPDAVRIPRDGRLKVAWIANIKPTKNPSAFLRLARSFAARTDVRFVMIGRPLLDDAWTRARLDEIRAAPNVDYLGALTQDEVNAVLREADVLVNTSEREGEGFSNTFIQAWMRRVPVVALNVDPDSLLSTGGLGAASHSEDQLHADVAALLDSPERRSAIGERCRAYSVAKHGEANLEEFYRLLQSPAPGALRAQSA